MRASTVVMAVVFASSISLAEPTLDEIGAKINSRDLPWPGCAPGSWSETRHTEEISKRVETNEVRSTLLERKEQGHVFESSMIRRTAGADGKETKEFLNTSRGERPGPDPFKFTEFKELPREDLKFGEKTYHCRVVEAAKMAPFGTKDGKIEQRKVTGKIWWSPDMPFMNGIVKLEGGVPVIDAESLGWSLIEVDREYKVGDRALKCMVFRKEFTKNDESQISISDMWLCPEAPVGPLRVESKSGGGGKKAARINWKMTLEVIDYHFVKEEKK